MDVLQHLMQMWGSASPQLNINIKRYSWPGNQEHRNILMCWYRSSCCEMEHISYQEIFSPHTYSWAFKLTNHLIQTGPSECYWALAPLSLIIYFGVIQGNCEPVHDVFSSSVWAVLDTTIDIPHVDFIILVKQLNHPRFILLFTYWWKNVVP